MISLAPTSTVLAGILSENTTWDVAITLAILAIGLGVFYWRRSMRVPSKIAYYDTPFPDVKIANRVGFPEPTLDEVSQVVSVCLAADSCWPEFRMRLFRVVVWIVRQPEQLVWHYGWREWRNIGQEVYKNDSIRSDPDRKGWGGCVLSDIGGKDHVFIATYHPNRSVLDLTAHEFTHALTDINGHLEPFATLEAMLRNTMLLPTEDPQ